MTGLYVILLVCLVCLHVSGVTYNHGYMYFEDRSTSWVRLPSKLLSLDDFDRYVAGGQTLPQIYFGVPVNPVVTVPGGTVFIQTEKRFTKTGQGRYSRVMRGVSETEPNTCRTLTFNAFVHRVSRNKAELVVDEGWLQVFWSSCPEKYIWFILCVGGRPRDRKCPLNNIRAGLLVQSIDRSVTFPWEDIVRDLKQTGLTFGTSQMNWKFTFGKNQLCPIF